MENRGALTKVLAIAGTVLVWFPLLAPVLLTAVLFADRGIFRFDYLMPAELFPSALAGGGLLLWAAIRARLRRGQIGWSLGAAVALLAGGTVLAAATGLASGDREPEGVWWLLTLGSIVGYALVLAAVGACGVLLIRDLRKPATKE